MKSTNTISESIFMPFSFLRIGGNTGYPLDKVNLRNIRYETLKHI